MHKTHAEGADLQDHEPHLHTHPGKFKPFAHRYSTLPVHTYMHLLAPKVGLCPMPLPHAPPLGMHRST